MTSEELIAEAREFADRNNGLNWQGMVRDLADALEAATAHDAEVAAKALEAFAERLVKHQEHGYGIVLPDVTEVVDDLRIAAAEYRKAVQPE